MAHYKNLTKLGSGGFGEVYRCKCREDGQIYVKKILKTEDSEDQKRFQREVRILSKLDHPNIIKIVGYRLSKPPLWYVMPLYKYSVVSGKK